MPNKPKPQARNKSAASKPTRGPGRPKASVSAVMVKKKSAAKAVPEAKVKLPLKAKTSRTSAPPTPAERLAAKAAEKAQKKLLRAEKAKAKIEAKAEAKALAKEAKALRKKQLLETANGQGAQVGVAKGKGLNLLIAPKGKAKPEKAGRKAKAPKPTRGPQFVAGTVFLPDGFRSREEIHYLFRGAVACVRESLDVAADEIRAKSDKLQPSASERELLELARTAEERFRGAIEAAPPNRAIPTKRTFASLVERARARRREIGAFMRGLDLGRTESSHLDTHSESSLQGLMEWGARLEMLSDSREVDKPDFTQQHRVLDQLESTTEMLVVDVELTLRRYKDRMSARGIELSKPPV